jgi:hypothetical protein
MSELKMTDFDLNPLLNNVKKVIESEINNLLNEHMERYKLLERTHQLIMQLPSVAFELGYPQNETNTNVIHEFKHNMLYEKLNARLEEIEKKYESIIPVLNKLVDKFSFLNNEIKDLTKYDNAEVIIHIDNNIENPSLVETSANENIEIHFEEELDEEVVDADEEEDDEVEEGEKDADEEEDDEVEEGEKDADDEVEEEEEEEVDDEEEEGEKDADEEVEEEVEEEEVNEEEEEVEEEEEEVEEEEEEEVNEEEEEEEEEEEVEVEEEEVEVEEEEVEEEEEEEVEEEEEEEVEEDADEEVEEEEEYSIETETKEEEDDDEEIFEIDIDDKTYCTNNDENGFIWELTEEGEQGEKIGYFKDSEPFFYADEN